MLSFSKKEYKVKIQFPVFSEKQLDRMPLQFNKSQNIFCSKELKEHLPEIFNEDTMRTLNHYANSKNASIMFSYLPSDMFHNTTMTVFKRGNDNRKVQALNLKSDTKDDFVNSIRLIYTRSAEFIKQLSENL